MHLPTVQAQGQYDPRRPVSLSKSLSILRRGLGDPTIRLDASNAFLAFRSPEGEATLHIEKPGPLAPAVFRAWGPGARWAVGSAPRLLGAEDEVSDFEEAEFFAGLPQLVQRAYTEHRDVVLPRTGRIFEHLLGAVLEQRVTGIEANYAWRWLIRHHGSPAPGPQELKLRLAPGPQQIASLQRWDWQAARVENQRAVTLRRAAATASRLQWWADKPLDAVKPCARTPGTLEAAMLSIPGIGPWTVAETLQRSHGSADHISVGDFHLAGFIGQVLTGRRVDDAGMLELLRPYAPHRQRVVRMLQLSGERKQNFGPRYAPLDHRQR